VAQRDEWVDVLKRRTDWFKIRTRKGKEGWVHREQMETTITELGKKSQFRDNLLKEFFSSRLEFGVSGGSFDDDPLMVAQIGYRFNKNLTIDVALAQVSGAFSSFQLSYLNLTAFPWHDTRLAPYFSVGVGTFKNVPRGTLVSAIETNATLANTGVGMRYYMTRNFVFRLEYRYYNAVIDENQSQFYSAYMAGFSFFY